MTGITRRRLLALGAGVAFLAAVRPFESAAQDMHQQMGHGQKPLPSGTRILPLPPLVEPDATGIVKLKVQTGRHSFEEGSEAASAGINGAYLGPLVRLKTAKGLHCRLKMPWRKKQPFIGTDSSSLLFSMAGRITPFPRAGVGNPKLRSTSQPRSIGSTLICTEIPLVRRIWALPV